MARRHPDVLFHVTTGRPAVALTLDDGPDPSVTPEILDVLAAFGARATFFMLGEAALAHGAIVGRAVAEGHEIGNHGWRDRPCRRLALPTFLDDLRRAHAVLSAHAPVSLMRPGSGLIRRDQRARAARPRLPLRAGLGLSARRPPPPGARSSPRASPGWPRPGRS